MNTFFYLKRILTFLYLIFFFNLNIFAQFSETRVLVLSPDVINLTNTSAYINVFNFLPKNHVKDGSEEYTKYIQNAINKHSKLRFPNFSLLIRGLQLKSNSILFFDSNSLLKIKPTKSSFYSGLFLNGLKNVKIYNLKVQGDRLNHLGKGGEHGFGVEIRNSSNVLIKNFAISECWGDGIIIDDRPEINKCTDNITLINGVLDYNRRDGISIISGDGINISKLSIFNTMGTNPMCGIMIEQPNHSANTLGEINIFDVKFNNNVIGIGLNLDNYFDGGISKPIYLNVNNCEISNSSIGISIVSSRTEKHLKNFSGHIDITNVLFHMNNINKVLPKSPNIVPAIIGL